MTVFNGKGVYGAIVSGSVCMLKKPTLRTEKLHISDAEISRFEEAKYTAGQQLQELYDMYIDQIGESNAQIFNIHMMMLEDEDYCGSITGMIESESVNAEYAVQQTSEVFAKMLESMRRCTRCFTAAYIHSVGMPDGSQRYSGKRHSLR